MFGVKANKMRKITEKGKELKRKDLLKQYLKDIKGQALSGRDHCGIDKHYSITEESFKRILDELKEMGYRIVIDDTKYWDAIIYW